MISRRTAFSALGLVSALLVSGCSLADDTFRYKMTVEVDTPTGVKTGYAVREMHYRARSSFMLGEGKAQLKIVGEAVAVDVGQGRVLFALLSGQDGYVDYAGSGVSTIFRVMDRTPGAKGGPHELWPNVPVIREPITDPLPMLVTFRDMRDPKSVERVEPEALDKVFGAGVKLRRITVQASDEDLTVGIEKRLGWLGRYPEPSLNPAHGPTDYTLAATIHHGDFREGTK